ncbi:MAG: MarR family transcriptional regulator [Candidatus Peregrinibacteria bacterium]|nr:MarR family transcriptional regulator [Candidatus Peregrinibacteria bacterium]
MSKNREELLQKLIEKMMSVMKNMHSGHCFPFGELKLSRPQVSILFFISKSKDGVSSKELAEFLNVTSGAITQFIDPLVDEKLIRREEDENDRRITRMTLTESAKDKMAKFKKSYHKSVSASFDKFSEEEIVQFITLFNKISK